MKPARNRPEGRWGHLGGGNSTAAAIAGRPEVGRGFARALAVSSPGFAGGGFGVTGRCHRGAVGGLLGRVVVGSGFMFVSMFGGTSLDPFRVPFGPQSAAEHTFDCGDWSDPPLFPRGGGVGNHLSGG